MKRLIAILLICILSACVFAACQDQGKEKDKNTATADTRDTDDASEEIVETFEIPTKYATLKYPKRWKDIAKIDMKEGEPYTVSFSVNDAKSFDLIFNGDKGDILGTLKTDKGQYLLTVVAAALDEKAKDYKSLRNMQEDINVMLDCLDEDYEFVKGVDAREEEPEEYAIKTSLVDLYYPQKWENKVKTEVLDDMVKFSCEDTPLFDIVFGGDKGVLIGSFDGTEIYIVDYPLKDNEMKNMQEDVNVIINYLQKEEKFVLA